MRLTGMPVHILTTSAISSSVTTGLSPTGASPEDRLPFVLQLLQLLRELEFPVTQLGSVLVLLVGDGLVLLAPHGLEGLLRFLHGDSGLPLVRMRTREPASSIRSMALSGRKRSEMKREARLAAA